MYCTYLTIYSGSELPKRYIGSSSIYYIEHGYHGSPSSKKYKDVWKYELLNNPNRFKTRILRIFSTRQEAFDHELFLQKKYKVTKSPLYINLALARKNGHKGRDVSGSNNPMFGKSRKGEIRKVGTGDNIRKGQMNSIKFNSLESKEKRSERSRGANNSMYGRSHTEEFKQNMSIRMTGINHPLFGVKKTDQERAHLSRIRTKMFADGLIVPHNKGKSMSEEQKQKLRKPRTEHQKQKLRTIYQIDGLIISNAKEYCKLNGHNYIQFTQAAKYGKPYKGLEIKIQDGAVE